METLFKCRGKCGLMLPESEFPRTGAYNGKTYRISICRNCRNLKKWPRRTISLLHMRPYLEEILNRSGGLRAGARELAITHTQLRVWLGRQPRYHNGRAVRATRVTRKSAAHILATVRRLRERDRYT